MNKFRNPVEAVRVINLIYKVIEMELDSAQLSEMSVSGDLQMN